MSRSLLKLVGTAALLLMPADAQFGVGKRKKGSSFEDLNELAKKNQNDDGGLADMMAGMGDYDLESLLAGLGDVDMETLSEMMSSPEYQKEYRKYLAELGLDDEDAMEKVGEAMKMLSDPEKLADALSEVMGTLGTDGLVDSIVKQKDTMLDQMEKTGLLTNEQIEQYRNNPDKFGKDLTESFSQMKELFNDPEIMKELQKSIDPKRIAEVMDAYKDFDLSSIFTDEAKSEEARLGLLDPSNPLSAMLAESSEMQEILNDPAKWKAAMKEGIDLLTNTGGAGAGVATQKGKAILSGDEL